MISLLQHLKNPIFIAVIAVESRDKLMFHYVTRCTLFNERVVIALLIIYHDF